MPVLLFICTANQCRSPMAEVIGRHLLTDRYPAVDWRRVCARSTTIRPPQLQP